MALVVSCGHDDGVVAVDSVDDGHNLFRLDLGAAFGSLNGCDISWDNTLIAVAGLMQNRILFDSVTPLQRRIRRGW